MVVEASTFLTLRRTRGRKRIRLKESALERTATRAVNEGLISLKEQHQEG